MKSSVRAVTITAIAGFSLLVLSSPAQALTISVGTQTAVSLPSAPRSIKTGLFADQSFYVVYTTANATSYSIMIASQTGGSASGGGAAPGWTVSTLFSTTTNASNSNIASVMDAIVLTNGQVLMYFYDAALGNLRCLTGAASAGPNLQPVSVATVTVAGIKVVSDGSGDATVIYSSQAVNGRYELRLASRTVANAAAAIGTTAINLSTSTAENVSGSFAVVKQFDTKRNLVFYYDALAGVLRSLSLDGTNNAVDTSRGTLDSGVITNIFAADFGAIASGVTRLVYTVGGTTVRYAVQRRAISGQTWYVQKIDDGTAAQLVDINTGPTVSYLKGGNLMLARGAQGIFFDDFKENITNAQLGIMTAISNVTSGAFYQAATGVTRDRGIFLASNVNAIGAFNWTSLRGIVRNTFATVLPSVSGSDAVISSNSIVGPLNGNATLTGATAGGVTDDTGIFIINVASGTINTVSVSSSPWVFINQSSRTQVNTSTLTVLNAGTSGNLADLNVEFVAYSSAAPVTSYIGTAVGQTSTFSVTYTNFADSITFSMGALSAPLSGRFNRSSNFRLVPQSAAGTVATVTTSTSAVETGAIPLIVQSDASGETLVTASTNTMWSMFASTNSSLPLYYTLVASTRTDAGHIMLGSFRDAVNLRPVEINFSSVPAGSTNILPALAGMTVINSTGLINTSSETTIVIRSTFPNIFSNGLVQNNIYLTTSTAVGIFSTVNISSMDVQGTDAIVSANGSTVSFHVAIRGLDTSKTWYVRIASNPASGVTFRNPQLAYSPPISFTTAAITSVVADQQADLFVAGASSTPIRFMINGRGFIFNNSAVISSTITISTQPAYNAENKIAVHSGRAISFQTISSTAMILSFRFNANTSTTGVRHLLYYSSVTAQHSGTDSGNYDTIERAFAGSTITLVSPLASDGGAPIITSTPAITAIEPATITNTRIFTLTLRGRGLLVGSTVQLFATDGSTSLITAATVIETNSGAQGYGMQFGSATLSVNVDLRNPQAAGKTFYVFMSSRAEAGGEANESVESSTNTQRISSGGSGIFLTVTSMTLTGLNYPSLTGNTTNVVYNSTTSVTLGLVGTGLVGGSTVTVSWTGGGAILNSQSIPLASVSSSGTYAAFTTTEVFKTTAGAYTVTVSSMVVATLGTGTPNRNFSQSASVSVNVLAASISTFTLASHPAAYTTLEFATYTVTGAGLLPNASYWFLSSGSNDRIGSTFVTARSSDFTSMNVSFDLRAATATADWNLNALYTDSIGTTNLFSTTTLTTTNALTISSIPVLTAIVNSGFNTRNNASTTLNLSGQGLAMGATIAMIYNGSAFSSIASSSSFNSFNVLSDTSTRIGTMTIINATAISQTSGTVTIDLTNAFGSSSWVLQMSSFVRGGYGSTVFNAKDDDGQGLASANAIRKPINGGSNYRSNTLAFTVGESSAPGAPTGLTVLSAGAASVTLQWIAPGDDGYSNDLVTGAQFIVYYSSGNGDRGFGCAACYPLGAFANQGSVLEAGTSNFSFTNTWAQYLPGGYADSARSTDTVFNPSFFQRNSSSSVRGLSVSTQTIAISAVTVKTSSVATGSTGNTSIAPGRIVQATLSINPGTTAGDFWFIVRAQDESSNLSSSAVQYSTTSATIGASGVTATDTIDPNATTTLADTSLGGGVSSGGTIPPGALEGSDTLNRTADSNPPADAGDVDVVGPAVDIVLGSGKTVFLKPITLTFALSGAALAEINSKTSNFGLVKVAFFNGTTWVLIRESSFDGTTVSCNISHLTKFAVAIAAPASNLNGAVVYPNPYRPSVVQQKSQKITFSTLPANTTIKIYTLAGDLVRSLKDDDGDGLVGWDAKNEDGQDVASGVYFALLNGASDTKTLKVAVQR